MFRFQTPEPPSGASAIRQRVRRFLAEELDAGRWMPRTNAWMHYDAEFSARSGAAGFIGVALPTAYGGHGRSGLERLAVLEEMLAAGAPVGLHWIADRQSGPQILRHGSESLRRRILPRIAQGLCCFCIGMSEPGAGSDLASVRTRAEREDGGWRLHGSKLWTSHAHRADYAIVLARTEPQGETRHAGMTQFVVDMHSPGLSAHPMVDLTGGRDFSEVVLDGVFVPDEAVLGRPGQGWQLVSGELALERSGPERFLSSHVMLELLLDETRHQGGEPTIADLRTLGAQVARLIALRQMSGSLAAQIADGGTPDVEAALVKDLGAIFEQSVAELARATAAGRSARLRAALAPLTLCTPSFSLRGGTREILRGIIAKRLEQS